MKAAVALATISAALAAAGPAAPAEEPVPSAEPAAEAEAKALPEPLRCRPEDKAAVVFFILPDCPVSNALVPEMISIVKDCRNRGVRFTFVYADPTLTDEDVERHVREFSIPGPAVRDPEHRLADAAGARIAPEAALVSAKAAEIVYSGRISDLFYAPGRKRGAARSHDLREAIDAVLEGKSPPRRRTEAVGCYLADLRPAEPENSASETPAP